MVVNLICSYNNVIFLLNFVCLLFMLTFMLFMFNFISFTLFLLLIYATLINLVFLVNGLILISSYSYIYYSLSLYSLFNSWNLDCLLAVGVGFVRSAALFPESAALRFAACRPVVRSALFPPLRSSLSLRFVSLRSLPSLRLPLLSSPPILSSPLRFVPSLPSSCHLASKLTWPACRAGVPRFASLSYLPLLIVYC